MTETTGTARLHEAVGPGTAGGLLSAGGPDLDAYAATGGYATLRAARGRVTEDLVGELRASGLRGRGGALFPAVTKWDSALATPAPRVVLANVAEDEPGSRKDRHLMATRPHLVLEGALLAAAALDAATVVLYVNETAADAVAAARQAVEEASDAGLLEALEVRVVAAPPVYVAGEDSAAISFVESGEAIPRVKPPYPTQSGLDGRPTVVHNAETLAHLVRVFRDGGSAFAAVGAEGCPGTVLATVPDDLVRPGVYEVLTGSSLQGLIDAAGGFVDGPARGIQVGGPAAGWLTGDFDVPLEPVALTARGTALGCLALRVLPHGRCAVDSVAQTSEFFARESCGTCPPCRMSTQFISRATSGLAKGQPITIAQLDQMGKLVEASAPSCRCSLVRFPLAPIDSARAAFPADFAAHLEQRGCGLEHGSSALTSLHA